MNITRGDADFDCPPGRANGLSRSNSFGHCHQMVKKKVNFGDNGYHSEVHECHRILTGRKESCLQSVEPVSSGTFAAFELTHGLGVCMLSPFSLPEMNLRKHRVSSTLLVVETRRRKRIKTKS